MRDMYLLKPLMLSMLLLCSYCCMQAQNDCSEALRQAQRLYDEGHPEDALKLLEGCIALEGFDADEAARALRLATIIHLAEQDKRAKKTFLQLLLLDPYFEVDTSFQSDPAELVYLYESFRTHPLFHVQFYGGINTTGIQEGNYYSVGKSVDGSVDFKNYGLKPGFQFGGKISFPIVNRNIKLSLGIQYDQVGYKMYQEMDLYGGVILEDISTDSAREANPTFFKLDLTEQQSYLQIPISLQIDFDRNSRYNFERRRFVPFINIGGSFHQLLQARYTNILRVNGNRNSVSSSDFDNLRVMRNPINFSISAGAGLKAKIGRNYLTMEGRYQQYFRNVINPDWRYLDDGLIYQFGHVDSDFRFRNFSFSVGYEIPFYFPKQTIKQ